jgi:hypothetical protein
MSFPVKLYVYDLSMGMAKQLSQQFVGKHFEGIWHTSIVVFGYEYFFGGGIQRMAPGMTPYGTPVQMIDLGVTQKTQQEFEAFVRNMNQTRFRLDRYHLFDNNCNHFSEEASQFLLSKSIPEHILSLPSEFFTTPMGQMLRPFVDQMMGGSANPNAAPLGAGFGGNSPFGNMDMNSMMNNPMVQNMMNDPNIMNMASQMMQQGGLGNLQNMDMNSLMSNPAVQNMMNDPNIMNMASQMMQQMGGGSGFGSNAWGTNPWGSVSQPQSAPTPTPTQAPPKPQPIDDLIIYRFKTSNVPQVTKKLLQLAKESNVNLTPEEEKLLQQIEQYLTSEKKDPNLITDASYQLLRMYYC